MSAAVAILEVLWGRLQDLELLILGTPEKRCDVRLTDLVRNHSSGLSIGVFNVCVGVCRKQSLNNLVVSPECCFH